MLAAAFREAILSENLPPRPLIALQVRNDYLEAVNEDLLRSHLGVVRAVRGAAAESRSQGVRASTIAR